ncbi:Fe-S cluster assembly protein SufD [Candidatus Cardinium hertigii]|uniref:FeS cluster assembly protein SufD n=1 Tax=Candidatus Cardinium hertigii TaxID=247481 RepID=A0A2Z3LH88_9BACT|nr:Fe-S cluster assembly protein SufD [Candidatus Cardinium hertigii]AWN81410.1 FeS cluster assembly protein SufD [Candidatus Cardinium hertigii]
MGTFIDWLGEAFALVTPTDPLYSERSLAFNRLSCLNIIENQKENYNFLQDLIRQLTQQAYVSHAVQGSCIQSMPLSAIETYGTAAAIVTFIDGNFSQADSYFDARGQAVQLWKWADLPPEEQQAWLNDYQADLGSEEDLFVLLNHMLCQEIYFLKINDTVDLKDIIVIQNIITGSVPHIMPRLLLKVGASSRVTIVEHNYVIDHTAHFINALTHVLLSAGAELSYYTLGHTPCYQVHTLHCNQKADSSLNHYVFSLGNVKLRMRFITQLNGKHATANLYGLYGLAAEEKVDYRVQIAHRYPQSFSKQHYKGIVGGQATAAFHGSIYVTPEAQQTNAYQTNNAIVLSPLAHHYVKPQLEIYADDVKCSHGATTGALDPTQLFYLQSRGIDADLAKTILLEAFGKEIIDAVPIAELKQYISAKLLAKLAKL